MARFKRCAAWAILPLTPCAFAVNQTISTSVTETAFEMSNADVINVVSGGVWQLTSPRYNAALYMDGGTINVDGGAVTSEGSRIRDIRIGTSINSINTLNIVNGGSFTALGFFSVGEAGTTKVLISGTGSVLNGSPGVSLGKGTVDVTLANGGTWYGAALLGKSADGNATLNIGAAKGHAAAAAGVLTGPITFGEGNNRVVFNHTDADYRFASTINGSNGALEFLAGTTTLTAASSFSGTTTVAGGTLLVDGALANSAVQVLNGATLGGSGSVGSLTTLNGSTVLTGANATPLSVKGDYLAGSGSTLLVSENPASALQIDGRAVIDAGARLQLVNNSAGNYTLNNRYAVLSATQGVSGQFTAVNVTAFYALAPTYDANTVYMSVQKTRGFDAVALTPNQHQTAHALDRLAPGNPLAHALSNSKTDAQARAGLGQLSGELQAAVPTALLEDSRLLREATNDRLRCASAELACQAGDESNGLWVRGVGANGQTDSTHDTAAFKRTTRGVLVGADTALNEWQLGVMAGAGRSTFNTSHPDASGASDNVHIGLYGGRTWGQLALRTGVAYSRQAVDTRRNVSLPLLNERLSGHHTVGTSQAFAELGYRLNTHYVAVEPFVNLAQVHQQNASFQEKGGDAALAVDGQTSDVTLVTHGVRASKDFTLANFPATAHGSLGWRHAMGDTEGQSRVSFGGGNSFAIDGAALAKNTAQLDTGLGVQLTRAVAVNVGYQRVFDKRATDQSATVSVSAAF